MSQAQTPPRETYQCAECGGEFDPYSAVHGSYCSADCFHRQKGRNVIQKVKSDHRWCASCFRPVKTIEQPPPDKSVTCGPVDHDQHESTNENLLIGFQYPTEFMTRAVDEWQPDRADDWRKSGASPADRVERTRWSCKCGAVDTGHRYRELEAVDPALVMTSAARLLAQLSSEGTIKGSFDRERFKAACRDHHQFTRDVGVYGHDWIDWSIVFGRALYR